MWFIYAIVTLLFWAVADLFYKIGAKEEDKYSHLKTGIMVGLVMGIHATIYLLLNGVDFVFLDLIKYLPVSFFYIASMVIGYKGLRYLELSIASPIQNCSGVITSILLFLIFRETLGVLDVIGIIVIGIGVTYLSILERKSQKEEKALEKKKLKEERKKDKFSKFKKKEKVKKIATFTALIFPLLYCILDGAGTFLDAIYLDKLELIGEDPALIAYEYTFFIYGFILFIYLKLFKKEEIGVFKVKSRLFAAIFETLGQFFYVFAISGNSTLACPIIASYSIGSVLLSRIFLKEKLSLKEYIAIFIVLSGIVILGISEGLA
ncbi:MAG: EamA family transporter [Bacilli bacterium]|nr:EamA family transporter [Bacilli bacterium]